MSAWNCLAAFALSSTALAQAPSPPNAAPAPVQAPEAPQVEDVAAPRPASSRVSSVTVYQGSALVTREVIVPEGKGASELVVTPLPARTIANSLFTEGSEGLRVLSTRFRTRAVREDTSRAVRAKDEEIKALLADADRIKKQIDVIGQNLGFLQKLETFTGATMQGVAEKGMLNGETTIRLTTFVMDSRAEKSTSLVALEQKLQANGESAAFARRQLEELSAGSSRTETDAVIVVDKANAPASTVRLNYLVGASTWSPHYRFRAGAEKDPVQLECLAAIEQQSGEDWAQVAITLSTAQPSLNATLPELIPLDIAIVGADQAPMQAELASGGPFVEQNRAAAREFRGQAQKAMVGNDTRAGGAYLNEAAALDQAEELLARDEGPKGKGGLESAGGPNVTYRPKGTLTVPSRKDPQLVEVARAELKPEYFAKTVPVLSPRVYRLARLTNSGDSVILPGEATMYVGSDFVGKMTLPQVAVGEEFTVGFGVDPQLQIGRKLVKKAETAQGGNQVHTYEFRIVVRNFKSIPANLQVWDRLPRAENSDVAVNLGETKPELSTDPLYVRNQRPDNLLRWDIVVPPGAVGDKAFPVIYQFKMEYAKEMGVHYLKSGGLAEAPIGGMGGMGGGMR
jgi:uncharacterized protein (TIGR02231 family)